MEGVEVQFVPNPPQNITMHPFFNAKKRKALAAAAPSSISSKDKKTKAKGDPNAVCRVCGKDCTRMSGLATHMGMKHPGVVLPALVVESKADWGPLGDVEHPVVLDDTR